MEQKIPMTSSADEIENKRFLPSLRGYDKDEVDSYLREIAAEFRQLQRAAEIAEHENALSRGEQAFRELGAYTAEVSRAVAEALEGLRAEAEQEAQRLLADARDDAAASASAASETLAEAQAELDEAHRLRAAADLHAAAVREAAESELAERRAASAREFAAAEADRQAATELRAAAEAALRAAEATRGAAEQRLAAAELELQTAIELESTIKAGNHEGTQPPTEASVAVRDTITPG